MTCLEKKILRELQFDFPLCPRPFKEIAARLGVTEARAIRAARRLKDSGFIRYIGPSFALERLGFRSTLVAMRVAPRSIKKTAAIINSYPHVTHNYLRKGKFNIWFTVNAPSARELDRIMNEIKSKSGVRDAINLKTRKVYKIDARFNVGK